MKKILIIVGPTAVGKTELSIDLAKKYNGEIISADSMQVYKNLNIGTAKVSLENMHGIKHYLLDEIDVNQRFSVADFMYRSHMIINHISRNNKLPILVGGTGFYLTALMNNYHLGNDNYVGDKIRIYWHNYSLKYGRNKLWHKLYEIDKDAAKKIPINNERRIIRALEVYQKTGHLFSSQNDISNNDYDFLVIGLNTSRSILYERINKRVDQMIKLGLVAEAKYLFDNGGESLPASKGIGYREFYEYFKGNENLFSCILKVKQNSRRYAKRQLTWFKNKMDVNWYDLIMNRDDDYFDMINLINKWLR